MFEADLCSNEFLLSDDHESLYALWTARMCGYKHFYSKLLSSKLRRIAPSDLAEIMQLEIDESDPAVLTKLMIQAQKLEQKLSILNPGFNGVIAINLKKLKSTLGLSKMDALLLGFFVLVKSNDDFEDVVDSIGEITFQQLVEVLSVVLGESKKDISQSLDGKSILAQSGLLKVDMRHSNNLSSKVDLLAGLEDVLTIESGNPIELLSRYFYPSTAPSLSLENYPHLAEETERVMRYLSHQRKRKGANILVYGPPGTGKTEWVKAIAKTLKFPLYEITSEDKDGDVLLDGRRVEIYKLAQHALQKRAKSLVMFDEVEDVFPHSISLFMERKSQSGNKGWINKVLEENPVPAFWISNSIRQIDSAYIRRFDLVIEIDTPPRSVRCEIIQNALQGVDVSQGWIHQLADHKQLVPAVISRAAKVVQTIAKPDEPQESIQNHMLTLINATLEAQGHSSLELKNLKTGLGYSLDYVNTDVDIEQLVKGMQYSQRGRFCLYGLPGTGKTAFGNFLAKALDRPLLIKRASDLLSPYVGVAEQNIARAFKEAKREGAVLQIDEADSFLQSRENAVRSWEVTQVNELLTQMESFEGVFIASTNLMKNIDQAALRRFDFKLEFKPLKTEQAWSMIEEIFRQYEIHQYDRDSIWETLKSMKVLTPGDFSAVMRKLSIGGILPEPGTLLSALEQECQFKPGYVKRTGIGFMSELSH
ncbi:AAA family ATPase [Thiomicrorhabdus cannonii]|uniref:AAA family ATPase n=1 Tax=Thiomicrorhabdus cannonii TaxID=2748011 RepID=UPI0015B8FC7A